MWVATILLSFLTARAAALSIVELGNFDWTITSQNKSVSVPAKFPSLSHLDLYAAGVIDNPLHNLNEFIQRWVAYQNWTYSAPVIGLKSDAASTWLVFDGLDTFTDITLCGKHVGNTDNMFRQWYFDVTDIVSACKAKSKLSINFGSAPLVAQAIANTPGVEKWPVVPNNIQYPFEIPNREYIRKEQSDFGWDWGPAFASQGPWKPGYLVQFKSKDVYVRNTAVDVRKQDQLPLVIPDQSKPWVINASIDLIGNVPSGAKMNYRLLDLTNKTVCSGALSDVNVTSVSVAGLATIEEGTVDRWWPNGYGSQTLYYLDYDLVDSSGSTLASVSKRIGFRTIVLNSYPVSDADIAKGIAPGNNWHFEVNGHEMYMKGSNFIPADCFWPRVTPDFIRMILESVKAGHQTMVRVWASGAYSPDFMHDIADELGIFLWSEFEFGDALYPVAKSFLDNVREEVIYNSRRLSHHPSLAFWAGGNELENLMLPQIQQDDPDHFDRWIGEYETLFFDTIFPALFENQRSISYMPSSTSNGWEMLDYSKPIPIVPRLYNTTAGSIYGETDFYNYDSTQSFNLSAYPVGRFSNEFGFHSMPSRQSWQQQVDPEYLNFNSSVVVLRNHHYPSGSLNTSNFHNSSLGMVEMTLGIERWLPTPMKEDSLKNFTAWCHATQVFQGAFIKSQIEFYRRGSGMPERQLGCLYWQLNDQWVASTWASMEYDGRWKVLHYLGIDIYSPVIIAPYFDFTNSSLEVYVTSDLWSEAKGNAKFTWYDWSGNPLKVSSKSLSSFSVGAINTTKVLELNAKDTLPDLADAVLFMEHSTQGQAPNTDTTTTFTHENYFAPISLADAKLVDPGLKISYSAEKGCFSVTATKGVAAYVWLDYPNGAVVHFDANAFWLRKGQTREVGYTVVSDTTGGKWTDEVTVESVWDLTTRD
ncbi:beta-mannosidase A [Rhizodiscina lignyota]|uniref:Beta-mannosidase A n=1 Tax=Rhizodiscina lignyota TaxID=1504668 RepID=A0A9P4IHK2_9PEZI|nr:beta-mannosidase A [Rhizodiscina lignyota]